MEECTCGLNFDKADMITMDFNKSEMTIDLTEWTERERNILLLLIELVKVRVTHGP